MLKRLFLSAALLSLAACAGTPPEKSTVEAPLTASARKDVTLPAFDAVTLDNGMQIFLVERHDVPLVSFTALIRGGAVADPDGRNGTAALLAELLGKGAARRNAVEFAQAVESVGGRFNATAAKEAIAVRGEFMSRDIDLMVELLGDVLLDPALARTEFDKLRERSIQQIRAMKDTSLRALTSVYGDAFLFGEHPYARAVSGTEAGLARTGYADLRRYYIEQFGADRTILAIVGDFDAATLRAALEKRFGNWRKAAGSLPEIPPPASPPGTRVLLVDKPGATQTYFYIGNVGVARDYDARAALELVNTVFGGRFTSMLNTKLRVESGLTYGASSRMSQYSEPGSLAMMSFTQTDSTVEAIDMALDTLGRLHAEGLSGAQLASAKAYVLGQYPPELETSSDIAARLAEIAFHGLDRSDVDEFAARIDAVTLDDARREIDAVYPSRDELVFVLIGDADAIRDGVAKYGPVTEMKISDPRFSR